MSKAIEEILAPKPEARPRIYAYSIGDAAHKGLLKVGQTTRNVKQRVAEQLKTAAIKNYRVELDNTAERDDGTLFSDHEVRAALVRKVIEDLSARLTERYGKGFSTPALWSFRQFYLGYSSRGEILFPAGRESTEAGNLSPTGRELEGAPKRHPAGIESPQAFSPQLSWSHYRALMRVESVAARDFYEKVACECGWSKVQLERQIHSFYYDRIVANRGAQGLLSDSRERLPGERVEPSHLLKSPMALEFLGLPDTHTLHESQLEQAIIENLQNFLLEPGKGFAFVARQKRIRFGDDDSYIDLVFYNFVLKCFLLLDLKLGKLTHADVGQMDGYVRLYEDRFKILGNKPTIGLLLCSDKSEAVAKYSILNENRQIFASKYLPNLPTEEQLRRRSKGNGASSNPPWRLANLKGKNRDAA